MLERIQYISHQGKQVLVVDLSQCSSAEVERIARAVPDYVTVKPRGSVLVLVDFTGASVDEEATRAIKESTVFDKPYIKKSGWVGVDKLGDFHGEIKKFSRRQLPVFKTRQEALNWLVAD